MPIMLQSCGKSSKARRFIRGANAPTNAVFLNCTGLPNPNSQLQQYKNKYSALKELDCVKLFLNEHAKEKLDKLVKKGVDAVKAGKPVVAQCVYGQHRSRAVLEMIAKNFHPSKVYYVHREI